MTRLNTGLLSATALGAITLALGAAPASAFDKVNWEWNLKINETITKNIRIDRNFDPTGVVNVEDIQVQIGNVEATSVVRGVHNNQPSNGGTGTANFTATFDLPYLNQQNPGQDPQPFEGPMTLNVSGTGNISGDVREGTDRVRGTATFEGITVQVDPTASFDARTELPSVVSAATAVGNNVSLESDVMVEMHDGQFLFALDPTRFDNRVALGGALAIASLFGNNYGDVNTHHLVGAGVIIGGAAGIFAPAEIRATSNVSDIINASVDSAATAVGNNKSITLRPHSRGDAVLLGDITQVSLANVTASSRVSDVTVSNYTNLGNLANLDGSSGKRPLVSSVATAVGNNLSIKVGGPPINP